MNAIQFSKTSAIGGFAALAVLTISVLAGCATPERSRDLGNPAVSGKTLAMQVCSNCHGVTGNPISPNFPRLAGQQETYFINQMNGFKSHHRSDPAGFEYMWGLSRHLSEQQINDLAAYYAAQPVGSQAGGGDGKLRDVGEEIFRRGIAAKEVPACATCHGEKGQGNGPFPRLAGQHADYLMKQLMVFQRTDQRPEGAIMKTVAHSLSGDDIQAVSEYLEHAPEN
ncbi:MAG TPA: c-type cytochrome [Rhodocyclaceae bacterium]|nr:c-type cytochrome [Rhodocyclaceae bacterium]